MSLQAALLLVGAVVVIVVAFNAFDRARIERRLRRGDSVRPPVPPAQVPAPTRAAPPPPSGLDINLAPPGRAKRKFLTLREWVQNAKSAVKPGQAPERQNPKIGPVFYQELDSLEEAALMPIDFGQGYARPGARGAPAQLAVPDEKLDFIVRLTGDVPVVRNAALGVYKQYEFDLAKPRRLYGARYKTGFWSDVQQDSGYTEYGELILAMQMVDVHAPVTEAELNAVMQLGLKLADELDRTPKFPVPMDRALANARALYQFFEDYDVIAAVNVVGSQGRVFGGRAIQLSARELGMEFGEMNIFHMKSDRSPACRHLFSMANLLKPGEFDPGAWDKFQTKGLTLFMSVPCAHRPAAVFDKMVTSAAKLSHDLGGQLQDQEQCALTKPGIDAIRAQIKSIDRKMEAFGVTPGTESALRLFGTTPDS
jgi:cell division protein ZipA